MILVSHAQGNAFVRALLAGLKQHSLPHQLWTTLGFAEDEAWMNHLPTRLQAVLGRRRYALKRSALVRHPGREIVRLAPNWAGLGRLRRHESGWASVDAIWHALDRKVAQQVTADLSIRAVYTYEDGAESTLRAAQKRQIPGYHDLPIGYWREAQQIFKEEAELTPAWAATLGGLRDSPAKLARKDRELQLASRIVVASTFTKRSLESFPGELQAPIDVVPYGAPQPVSAAALKSRLHSRKDGPLKVLFIGGLSQRKGLSYLFEAVGKMGAAASLTVVGRFPEDNCPALKQALGNCRYIPTLAPNALFELMREHDLLALPSLFEGFGLVLLEAMAQGLPVIATPHTAAPDLITSGKEGFIVPIRDVDALVEALDLLARDTERRETMALAARALAEHQRWENYGAQMAKLMTPTC